MTEVDLTRLQPVLTGLAPQGRSALLPALHAAQKLYGWLPEPVAAEIGRALRVPLADVHGVIDFYAMFYRRPAGRTIVRPGAVERNREFLGADLEVAADVAEALVNLGCDAQTSGGLLIAIPPERRERLVQGLAQRGVSAFVIGQFAGASEAEFW